MTSTSSTPPKETGASHSITPLPGFTDNVLDPSAVDSSKINPTPSDPPKKKRQKSVRTAIRQLLGKSTTQAIGEMGDTEDGSNKRVVGSSTMQIETGTKPGQTPSTKHVHVSVIMSVSDDPACACPFPPVVVVPPVTPIPPKAKKWWWVVVPILLVGLYSGNPTFKDPLRAVGSTPPVTAISPVNAKPSPTPTSATPPGGAGVAPTGSVSDSFPASNPVKINAPIDGSSTGAVTGPGVEIGIPGNGEFGNTPGNTPGNGIPPVTGASPTIPAGTIPSLCSNSNGEFRTAPEYAVSHSPQWVKKYANSWFVKRLAQCGVTVQVYDLCGLLLDLQRYGDNGAYLGQTLYARNGSQLQIDQLDTHDQLVSRTTYIKAVKSPGVTMAYAFDAQLHRIFEARMTRGADGSLLNVALWSFSADGRVTAQNVYVDSDQVKANVSHHFDQFSEFMSGSW